MCHCLSPVHLRRPVSVAEALRCRCSHHCFLMPVVTSESIKDKLTERFYQFIRLVGRNFSDIPKSVRTISRVQFQH